MKQRLLFLKLSLSLCKCSVNNKYSIQNKILFICSIRPLKIFYSSFTVLVFYWHIPCYTASYLSLHQTGIIMWQFGGKYRRPCTIVHGWRSICFYFNISLLFGNLKRNLRHLFIFCCSYCNSFHDDFIAAFQNFAITIRRRFKSSTDPSAVVIQIRLLNRSWNVRRCRDFEIIDISFRPVSPGSANTRVRFYFTPTDTIKHTT